MSTASLRPILRPSTLPSLPFPTATTFSSSSTTTTYICQSCRHARLLRRPKRPYTFTQLVTLSDGSAFTMRTTSPVPVYRSTRDTRNAPLWNPRSKELLNVEDDEAGRLAGFRARFGTGYDAQRRGGIEGGDGDDMVTAAEVGKDSSIVVEDQLDAKSPFFARATETKYDKTGKKSSSYEEENEYYDFGEEEDANLLDLISSYGREVTAPKAPVVPTPGGGSGKKGKK